MFEIVYFSLSVISSSLLFSETFATFINPAKYHFNVTRLEQCDEQEKWNLSLSFVNFKVVQHDGTTAIFSGIIDIVKPIQINFRLSVHGLFCDSSADRTCEHNFVRQFGFICRKLQDSNGPWHEFLQDKFVCPIPIGYYNMDSPSVNINTFSQLPLGPGYWVIKVYGYQGKEVIMCVYSEMEIFPVQGRA